MQVKVMYWLLVVLSCRLARICCMMSKQTAKELERTMLPLFGLSEPPNLNSPVPIPKVMRAMYSKQIEFQLDTASIPLPGLRTLGANTIRSLYHQAGPIDRRFTHPNRFRLKFKMPMLSSTERVTAAELRLHCHLSNSVATNVTPTTGRLLVHDIVQPGIKGETEPITRVIDSVQVGKNTPNPCNGAAIQLNVFPAVQRWLEINNSNHGLLISYRPSGIVDVTIRPNQTEHLEPVLILYSDDGRNRQKTGRHMSEIKRRSKRGARSHRKSSVDTRDPCRRRSMYVNFQDVGWSDWIVAPLGFEAYYCLGECEYPMADHMNTTNHAIVQSLMNSAQPYHVPKPCCVPTNLSSMSMLYVDGQKNVILKNYKDMVVIGCGCR